MVEPEHLKPCRFQCSIQRDVSSQPSTQLGQWYQLMGSCHLSELCCKVQKLLSSPMHLTST